MNFFEGRSTEGLVVMLRRYREGRDWQAALECALEIVSRGEATLEVARLFEQAAVHFRAGKVRTLALLTEQLCVLTEEMRQATEWSMQANRILRKLERQPEV